MAQKILQIGHPALRKPTLKLTTEEILDDRIQTLIHSMCETMRAAPGVGLAAPQIGESLQIIVIEDRPEYSKTLTHEQREIRQRIPIPLHILINPKITEKEAIQVEFFEGCLSTEGFIAVVPRAFKIKVTALNEKAELVNIQAQGWYARILQHEIDHLNGILCTDRMYPATLMTIPNYTEFWSGKSVPEVLR